MLNVVLLDRDGVVNRDRPASVCRVADLEVLPGAPEAIALLNRKGYQVLLVTNQACVGRGHVSPAELERIHHVLRERVARAGGTITGIYVCPHTEADRCACRKPRPGLVEQARHDYPFDPTRTWLLGDALRDVQAAQAAGCRPALVRTGKGARTEAPPDVPVFEDLLNFAHSIDHGAAHD